ncbi:hypothetical protein QQS21_010303 [Conoideocrella luteorostrata]|uniref:DUF7600 domain-containing protein n=1 Tax=Conoideocrella luteorostrata TaxID=1105319 RepID=A0AAJ0CFJ7_9HYPO|nr:hypothetical protein QQS21_010303 [Conoideocrella luteorostrata]
MKNRERVWRLVETVKAILCLEWIEPTSYSVTNVTHTKWLTVAGDIRPETAQPYHGFDGGCRQFYEKQIHIPPGELLQLAFSFIHLRDATYITGITLILVQGEIIRLGYMADKERILDSTDLTGFVVAVGSRGIHGIQCILGGDRESPWVGCPDNTPKTSRLKFIGPITSIRAAFDGYKMVSLSANGCIRPGNGNLLNSALWYPHIPYDGLDMNEGSFTARETAITRYNPTCWTMFGGPSGIYLRSLTGVSITANAGCLMTMEFHYNSEDVPLKCRKLGKCTPSEYAKTVHFEIDGPGGEIINALTVNVRQYPTAELWYYIPGVLESFKKKTSRRIASAEKTIALVEGSTINGLFWTQVYSWTASRLHLLTISSIKIEL